MASVAVLVSMDTKDLSEVIEAPSLTRRFIRHFAATCGFTGIYRKREIESGERLREIVYRLKGRLSSSSILT